MITLPLLSSLLLLMQGAPAEPPATNAPADPPLAMPLIDARLSGCLAQARSDSAAAIVQAEQWRAEITAGSRALPLQCLGTAYANRSMWAEAEAAFAEAAADLAARPAPDPRRLSALHAQAGNAALANGDAAGALTHFNAGLSALDGMAVPGRVAAGLHVDRARALVALSRDDDAAQALIFAQEGDPQDATAFLLGATLARRTGRLADAARAIAVADALSPGNPDIMLEGGLIAAMAGDDLTAASAWRRIVESAPGSETASRAQFYLQQLDAMRSDAPSAPASKAPPPQDPDMQEIGR
ncbi:hypothetical protein [Croceicoccus hydrothermalis]|uniref:hypothetical protein n=1 Tax=Croceicoccus hydrothermalis TaxID=2867964 RepID=UPI001EFAABE8|nr:hypothetical protein [Croceicoccus hydrothermalis]